MQSACATFYCHTWPVRLYNIFRIISSIFERKVIYQDLCVLIFATNLSEIFLILRRNKRQTIITNVTPVVMYSDVILVRWKFKFSYRFSENPQTLNFTTILQWEPSCCMRADGQTDGPSDRQTDRYGEANSHFFFAILQRARSPLYTVPQTVQAPASSIF
jgi:hypothetical protein